jgi:hypothetical protein
VRIGFATAALALTFSELDRLRRAFGDQMAYKIANRMAVLDAADSLALVPITPPIGCHRVDGAGHFAVTISNSKSLVFRTLGAIGERRKPDLARITQIEINGVE